VLSIQADKTANNRAGAILYMGLAMEFDFTYQTETKSYSLQLSSEQLALQCFLLDEFEHKRCAYQPLLLQLQQLNAQSLFQWDGTEYRLMVQDSEVIICHYSLLQGDMADMQLDPEQDLSLDQSQLYAECGLEDLLHLIELWQEFLPA
jgi:uncharacterized protein YacL (UPF0231 family)